MYYDHLFQMLGYEIEEIRQEAPRIEKVLAKLKVDNEEAIKHCEEVTQRSFDVSLQGVRGMLRVYLQETLDYCLAGEERELVVHIIRPAGGIEAQLLTEVEKGTGGKIWARSSIQGVQIVLGNVFDVINPLIEIGEKLGQSAGRGHCSEYQIYAGALDQGILPVPDVSLCTGYFCDQSPIADQLLAEMFGYETIEVDGSLAFQWEEWPNFDPRNVEYPANCYKRAFAELEEKYGVKVTEEHVVAATNNQGALAMAYMTLARTMFKADPQPISQADMALAFYLYAANPIYLDQTIAAFKVLAKEIRQRVKDGVGVVPKGAPRVFVTLRHITDMAPIKLIEELGLAVPFMMMDAIHPGQMAPSGFPDDPWARMMEAYYRVPHFSDQRGVLDWWQHWAETFDMDGWIHLNPIMCRPWASPALMSRKNFRDRGVDMPYLYLEADGWDTRFYSAGAMRTRVESFAEILRMQKEAKLAEQTKGSGTEEEETGPIALPDSWIQAAVAMGLNLETTADLTLEMMAGVGTVAPQLLQDLTPEMLLSLEPDSVAVLPKDYLDSLDPELKKKLSARATS